MILKTTRARRWIHGLLKPISLAVFASVLATSMINGCGYCSSVTSLPAHDQPAVAVDEGRLPAATSAKEQLSSAADESTYDAASWLVDSSAHAASRESNSELEPQTPATSSAETQPAASAPQDRVRALGQFGGGGRGGGGGGMMGGMGGGGGGMGGMGGGGMGGMGGGGGGVSIDPKIQLKKDSSGKLDERRKEATSTQPTKGGFSSK